MTSGRLQRCEAHGLVYDPSIHQGCTLCRNSSAPGQSLATMNVEPKDVAMVLIMALWVVGVLYGAYYGVTAIGERAQQARAASKPTAPMPAEPGAESVVTPLPPARSPAELPMLRRPGKDEFGYPRDAVDEVGLLALLHAKEYAALTRHLEALEASTQKDFHEEEWMTQAMNAFDSADPRVGERIEEWIAASPSSFVPVLARAEHRTATAWYYRGGQYAQKTAKDRLGKFQDLIKLANADVGRALEMRPSVIAGYQLKIWIAAGITQRPEKKKALDAALRLCPACFRVRSRYEVAISPRWGGSLQEMERFAVDAQARAAENPRLKALLGYADDERCQEFREKSNYTAALEACNHALAAGHFARFFGRRSDIFKKLERKPEALADIDRALDEDPQNSDYLVDRSSLLLDAGRYEDAVADLNQAVFLAPLTSEVQWGIENAVKKLFSLGYQRAKVGDDAGAAAAHKLVQTLSPANAEALKWKVASANRLTTAERVAQLEAASRADPGNFDTFKQIDDELVNTQQFARIIGHWNRYLAEKPDDARAYVERGGAYSQLGELDRALADFERACSKGLQAGCSGVQYVHVKQRPAH